MPAQPSPDIYAFLDCRLDALSPAARLVVQAAREWLAAARAHICPVRMMAPGLILAGQGQLVAPLHRLLLELARGLARPDVLCAPPADRVSEDEALLLVSLAAARSGKARQTRFALASLVRPHHLAAVTHAALLLGAHVRGPDGLFGSAAVTQHRRAA